MDTPTSSGAPWMARLLLYSLIPLSLLGFFWQQGRLDEAAAQPELAEPILPGKRGPASADPDLYALEFGSQTTLNDRCPRLKAPLNPRVQPLYVNGFPVGFC